MGGRPGGDQSVKRCKHEYIPLLRDYRGCIHCRRVETISRGRNRLGVLRWNLIHQEFWDYRWKEAESAHGELP